MADEPTNPTTPPAAPVEIVAPPPAMGTPAAAGAASATGLTPNVAAGLAVLFGLVSGIVFLVIEKRDPLVRFWAMQSIVLSVAIIAFGIVVSVVIAVIGKIPLIGMLFGLAMMVCYLIILAVYLIALVQAFSGKEWEVPFLGKITRQQLAKFPAT